MFLKNKAITKSMKKPTFLIILLFIYTCFFITVLIPPFQSPDEFDHLKRAYLWSRGTIVLDSPEGSSSGGMIDKGLSSYMSFYEGLKFKFDRKISLEEIDSAKNINWMGIKEYSPAPGTGYYFPMIYTPQAIGLVLGEKLGISVDASYHLSRVFAFVSAAIILFAAFSIYNVNSLVLSLLFMPMSIFQFSSASLDGISAAMSIFVIAAFLKIANDKENTDPKLFYIMTLFAVLVVTSRVHLLPIFLLLLASCFYTKRKLNYLIFVISLLCVFFWIGIAIKTTAGH